MSGRKPSEVRLDKPALFPSVKRFLDKHKPEKESPLPNQSRLPTASSSKAQPTFRYLQEPEKPNPNQRILLSQNTGSVTSIRNRLATGRKEGFFFLTIPGIIRIIEVLVAVLNIGAFGFYCTFYEDVVEFVIPPFFLATTREVFFALATFSSLIGCICLVIGGIFSSLSNRAIISSLYPFVFDLIQFLLVVASSLSNIQFYARHHDVLLRIAPKGLHVKNGIAISGLILSILHFISGIYDIIFFFKRIEFKQENGSEEDEEEMLPSVSSGTRRPSSG